MRRTNQKASYKWEEYGGSIGGPIIKRKLFFFFDIEKDQFDQPFTVGAIVPTALERQGNFSQSYNPDGTPWRFTIQQARS